MANIIPEATVPQMSDAEMIAAARKIMEGAKLTGINPTPDEMEKFHDSFERMFVYQQRDREMVWLYQQYKVEALAGLMVMKEQTKRTFDGTSPRPGTFGIRPISPFNFVADNWDYTLSIVSGDNNWIDAAFGALTGTAGSPSNIGEAQVMVAIAYQSFAAIPIAYALKVTQDGNERARESLIPHILTSELQVVPFDSVYFFKKDTTVLIELFNSDATATAEVPALVGFSFINEDKLRVLDPQTASLFATRDDLITQ